MKAAYITFTGKNEVQVMERMLPEAVGDSVLIETFVSLISNGTERTILSEDYPSDSHWAKWVRYPFRPGYACVGRIIDAGDDVPKNYIGTLVAVRQPHASHLIAPYTACISIPTDLHERDSAWFALARIGYLGRHRVGEVSSKRILVIGGGPVAQMVVRWISHESPSRLTMICRSANQATAGRLGGAHEVILSSTSALVPDRLHEWMAERPEIVVDCTNDPGVTSWSLKVVADYGHVVLVGDPGYPTERRLTSDIMLRSLTVSGAHDSNRMKGCSDKDVAELFFGLIQRGKFSLDGLCQHEFHAMQAREAYEVLQLKRGNLGIVLDWRNR